MKNSLLINGVGKNLSRLISDNRLDEAVDLIFNAAHQTVASGKFRGMYLRLPELDSGLLQIAKIMRTHFPTVPQVGNNHVCLVTEVYKTGGHRTMLNSICEEIPSHVIFTDLFNRIATGKINLQGLITPKSLSSITINANSLINKVQNIVNMLNSLSPRRVWMFNHHQDVVSLLAALIFDEGRRSIFVHHCDHEPALGAAIKFPVHLDFTGELLENCASIGLKALPLTLYTTRAHHRASFDGSELIVATAGSINKFTGSIGGVRYRDVVKTVLQHPRVSALYHIGEVPNQYVTDLKSFLFGAGIDPDRMKFAGQVPQVSDYLLSIGARLYLSSFPVGAGATTAEVQSAGIPVIYFDSNQKEMPLCAIKSIYATKQLEWRQLEDIHPVLDEIVRNWSFYSDAAFQKYAECFSREVFLNQIEKFR